MKANEFRIGNHINYDNRTIVVQLSDLMIMSNPLNSDRFETTKLTEEWLLKFGFEKNHYFEWTIDVKNEDCLSDFVLKYNSVYGFRLSQEGCYVYSEIKYVHQIQNLYFALTGKELEIKA